MSREDATCSCDGSGFINDPKLGNLICDCTFKQAGLGVVSEKAPRFRSVPNDNCIDCSYATRAGDFVQESFIHCSKFDFRVPYPAAKHVCDDFTDE